MFLSLNRKIIYLISVLTISSCLLFVFAFYYAYSLKIEKDQISSIRRNQQYNNLLLDHIGVLTDIKQLITENPHLTINQTQHPNLYKLAFDENDNEFLLKEYASIAERNFQFREQYRIINHGMAIIIISAILQIFFIVIMGWIIKRLILDPINDISYISDQVGSGNLNIRISRHAKKFFVDELDNLATTFNNMLDELQRKISQINEDEKFLQAIIDGIPDGVRVIDENYNIIIANKSYYKLVKRSPSAHAKCYSSAFCSGTPCNTQNFTCPLREILQHNHNQCNVIQRFSRAPESYLAINAAPLIYNQNKHCIIESIRDLRREIDFSHQQKILSLSFLSSSIAHEIKNQLGALKLIIEHFINDHYGNKPDNNKEKQLITMIHNEIISAELIPERLLKLIRNNNNVTTTFDCVSSINETINLLDYEAKIHGTTIKFYPPSAPVLLTGNEPDFKIAAINIILNAIKAMPQQGLLKIKIHSSSSGLRIDFEDNGVGISPEDIDKIFTPFFTQGHQFQSSQGTGLGLSITKSIIEKHHGHIEVSSSLGQGTCFSFIFPKQKNLQKPKQKAIKSPTTKFKKDKTK